MTRLLKDLPKHMQTREWILSAIRYEDFEGVLINEKI